MSSKIPEMRRAERRRLLREGRKSGDVATAERFQIVALLGAGRRVVEVARLLGVAIAHVSRTQARFVAGGAEALYDRRRGNGERGLPFPPDHDRDPFSAVRIAPQGVTVIV